MDDNKDNKDNSNNKNPRQKKKSETANLQPIRRSRRVVRPTNKFDPSVPSGKENAKPATTAESGDEDDLKPCVRPKDAAIAKGNDPRVSVGTSAVLLPSNDAPLIIPPHHDEVNHGASETLPGKVLTTISSGPQKKAAKKKDLGPKKRSRRTRANKDAPDMESPHPNKKPDAPDMDGPNPNSQLDAPDMGGPHRNKNTDAPDIDGPHRNKNMGAPDMDRPTISVGVAGNGSEVIPAGRSPKDQAVARGGSDPKESVESAFSDDDTFLHGLGVFDLKNITEPIDDDTFLHGLGVFDLNNITEPIQETVCKTAFAGTYRPVSDHGLEAARRLNDPFTDDKSRHDDPKQLLQESMSLACSATTLPVLYLPRLPLSPPLLQREISDLTAPTTAPVLPTTSLQATQSGNPLNDAIGQISTAMLVSDEELRRSLASVAMRMMTTETSDRGLFLAVQNFANRITSTGDGNERRNIMVVVLRLMGMERDAMQPTHVGSHLLDAIVQISRAVLVGDSELCQNLIAIAMHIMSNESANHGLLHTIQNFANLIASTAVEDERRSIMAIALRLLGLERDV